MRHQPWTIRNINSEILTTKMVVPTVKLNNGCTIPIVGLGTWKVNKQKIENKFNLSTF